MENEIKKEKNMSPITSIIIVIALITGTSLYTVRLPKNQETETLLPPTQLNKNTISFQNGVELPVRWKDMGVKMVEAGVIDKAKFENLYSQRGGLSETEKKLLTSNNNENLVITPENSGVI